MRATIGQRYYFEDERVGLTPTSPLRTVARLRHARLGRRAAVAGTGPSTPPTQYSRHAAAHRALHRRGALHPEPAKVHQRELPLHPRPTVAEPDRHLGAVAGRAPAGTRVGRYNYSLPGQGCSRAWRASSTTPAAGCSARWCSASRRRPQVSSTAFFFQLEFNGVGQIGTDDVVRAADAQHARLLGDQPARRRARAAEPAAAAAVRAGVLRSRDAHAARRRCCFCLPLPALAQRVVAGRPHRRGGQQGGDHRDRAERGGRPRPSASCGARARSCPSARLLERQILERLIIDKAQVQLARETGIRVDELQLDRAVQRIAEENNMTLAEFRARAGARRRALRRLPRGHARADPAVAPARARGRRQASR